MARILVSKPWFNSRFSAILPLRSCSFSSSANQNPRKFQDLVFNGVSTSSENPEITFVDETFPFSGVGNALMGLVSGKRKATEVAQLVWQSVVRKGDRVIDATCGNGYDTLALLKMVADQSGRGRVYGMDVQESALQNTRNLLDESVNPNERKLVELFLLCHSKMEDIVPEGIPIRLVAFNLGYLPGGDKTIITTSKTTLPALQAASRLLESGGLISIMVYVGHPSGR